MPTCHPTLTAPCLDAPTPTLPAPSARGRIQATVPSEAATYSGKGSAQGVSRGAWRPRRLRRQRTGGQASRPTATVTAVDCRHGRCWPFPPLSPLSPHPPPMSLPPFPLLPQRADVDPSESTHAFRVRLPRCPPAVLVDPLWRRRCAPLSSGPMHGGGGPAGGDNGTHGWWARAAACRQALVLPVGRQAQGDEGDEGGVG